jgi:hypothetical protein
MQLDKIITLANKKVYHRFIAMERSLRATGCSLPVWVIPYDDNLFELPDNCFWVEAPNLMAWLKKHNSMGMYRKYYCLMQANYQYVDSDVVFLRNPQEVLQSHEGFITSCGHWHNPGQTYTKETLAIFKKASTTWQAKVFNAGQFACSQKLFDFDALVKTAEEAAYIFPCLQMPHHDQAGLNLLVHLSGVPVTNLTLPPYQMQSTWAGDYKEPGYEMYWKTEAEKPYLIHWAGCNANQERAIDALFLSYLHPDEKPAWEKLIASNPDKSTLKKIRRNLSRVKIAFRSIRWEW